jgi:K+-sensing histidine kinase KdpD
MNEQQIAERENKISDSANALLDTMEAMLLWSKGQMEHFKPSVAEVAVNDLFIYLEHFFTGTEHVSFSFENQENLILQTDEDYLKTIMHNLTANAVKALQQTTGAKITWKAWKQQTNIYLSIIDNGTGVSKEQLKALYDETATSGSRHGLGLHIIRDLAKAIGCSITLQPQTKTGTEFILCI